MEEVDGILGIWGGDFILDLGLGKVFRMKWSKEEVGGGRGSGRVDVYKGRWVLSSMNSRNKGLKVRVIFEEEKKFFMVRVEW